MSEPEIIARLEGHVARLTLNRPKALHALNTAMCVTLTQHLLVWMDDPEVAIVLIDHAGDRGFCAGGDIRMLAESGAKDGAEARTFFFTEYRLNALLMAYPKPIAVIMDGIVMGGGVGIALPCRLRIASERTAFAMPETGIGLFPDVGGGWHLSRLPGEVGLWLALTAARIKAADCLRLGLATHVVESARLETLKAIICHDPGAVDFILKEFQIAPGPAPIAPHLDTIDATFCAPSVESILPNLLDIGSDWAIAQRDILLTKSPQSLKVAYRQLRTGRTLTSFETNMAMEYRIAARVVRRHDFLEGVRATIVEKDNAPRWLPADLAGVTDAMLDKVFSHLPPDQEWTPLKELA